MEISNNLISQFVKITNDREKRTQQSKLFGTTVICDDKQYVQIDGSDLLTPADSTVDIKDGDRVTVSINNHTAIIDGNLSDISASNKHLLAAEAETLLIKDDFVDFKDVMDATLDGIESKVSEDGIGTVVKQNAESWGISINGKLKGTNYTFDGDNFTIGSTTGNTTAYHAAGYSKWVHTDGSYTRIDAEGMTWSKGSTSSGYHYLMYAGECTCDSESTVTVTLPDEFKGKNFKVVTSIKRIYISDDSYLDGCYFPLLSFYAEALNINNDTGQFQVYASIRAWNRTGYSDWGQMIGNGATAAEKSAIKPVVAYWAFV